MLDTVPIRAQSTDAAPLQLRTHPNPVIARQVADAIEGWEELQQQDPDLLAGLNLGLPATLLVKRLRATCAGLPDGHESIVHLNRVIIPLAIMVRIMDLSVRGTFVRLGASSFATVFVSEGRGNVVVKQVKNPSDAALLGREHRDLEQLYQAYLSVGASTFFSLPRPYGYYSDYGSFAKKHKIPCTLDLRLPPHAMYVMQRIWPVSISIREQIREMFFPDRFKEQPFAPFLSCLYLGKVSSQADSQFFCCSENYPLDASRMEILGLPMREIAAGMGEMLALINFQCGRDARGIKFVLCGDPDDPLSEVPAFSCIDFNQMRPHNTEVDAIVSSITGNDPYFSRPSSPYWESFAAAYVAGAAAVGPQAVAISRIVLDKVHELWK